MTPCGSRRRAHPGPTATTTVEPRLCSCANCPTRVVRSVWAQSATAAGRVRRTASSRAPLGRSAPRFRTGAARSVSAACSASRARRAHPAAAAQLVRPQAGRPAPNRCWRPATAASGRARRRLPHSPRPHRPANHRTTRTAPSLTFQECSGHHRKRPSRLVAQIRGIPLSPLMTPAVVQNARRCAPSALRAIGAAGSGSVAAAVGRPV